MNILIITPRMPFPPFRGDKLKIFNISKILVKSNKVKILTFISSENENEGVEAYKKLGIEVETIFFPVWKSIMNCFFALFSSEPFQIAWFRNNEMQKKIDKELGDNKTEVVYYHLIRSSQYLNKAKFPDILHVLDFTDAVSLYLNRLVDSEKNILKKIMFSLERNRIEKKEIVCEKFDSVYICSESDKSFLLNKGIKADISILENGIDNKQFSSSNYEPIPNRIIFTGNMPYFPNTDAAIFLSKEIFPSVIKQKPDAKLFLVGQNPSRQIKNLQSNSITVTGFVDDIKAEYLKSMVNVAPMRFGAGTLNKIIESLALGVPVVASSIAVSGMPRELKEFVFTANNTEEYVAKICWIFDHFEEAKIHVKGASKTINLKLGWEVIVQQFETELLSKVNLKRNFVVK